MAQIEHSSTIARPVPEVFAYMDDVERELEWQPNLRTAVQEPVGPVGVGTLKRYTSTFLKKNVANVYRVVHYEMYVRVVYETTPDSAMQATIDVRWDPVPEGTQVTMRIDATPGRALKLVPRKLLEKTSKQELESMMDALRSRLEMT